MYTNYLKHHGIKGQRWYQRLYQNEDGSLTPLGRIHYGVGKRKNKTPTITRINKQQHGKQTERLSDKDLAERREKILMEGKNKALKTGDISFASKYPDLFTNAEIDAVLQRYKKKVELASYNKSVADAKKFKVKKVMDAIGEYSTSAVKAINGVRGAWKELSNIQAVLEGKDPDSIFNLVSETIDKTKNTKTVYSKNKKGQENRTISYIDEEAAKKEKEGNRKKGLTDAQWQAIEKLVDAVEDGRLNVD